MVDPFASATAMLGALRERRVSSTELVELHLERIARYNPRLNAIVVPATDPRAAAASADLVRTRGENGPLLGLPVTLKESMNVRGLATAVGMPESANYRARRMARLRRTCSRPGRCCWARPTSRPCSPTGRASTPSTAGPSTRGTRASPPGGSTGGGAAAVAAGLSPLEFGSDIGGSIRVPAAFCGIFGHKPSETLVPRSGQFAFPARPNAGVIMGVQGPLARTADDLELGLDVVAGAEVGEDVAWRLDLPPARAERLADFRIAILPRIDWLPVAAEVSDALEALASKLSQTGATVCVAQPESFGDLRDHHGLYLSVFTALTSGPAPRDEREASARQHEVRPNDQWGPARAAGLRASIADWMAMHSRREEYRAAYRAFFREWDVLLAPIALRTAFLHLPILWPPDEAYFSITVDVDGQAVPYDDQLVYPAVATLSGQPATAFPVGLSRAGLPIGLQAIGPYLEDRTPIRLAALIARDFGGYAAPPGYAP